MARVAAGVCCLFALGGLDVGVASRHWLTDGSDVITGLVQSQAHSGTWWNFRYVQVAHEMQQSGVSELALVVSGVVTLVLGGLAGLLLAIATGIVAGSPRAGRRCARAAQLLALSSAATAVAFVYLQPLLNMHLSWSALAFGGGVLATLFGAAAVRAEARRSPIHTLA